MKYMISWFERPQGSPKEDQNAQKRILDVFTKWKAPSNFKIELFVVRVGEWGGHMLVDCDDPATVHKACSNSLHSNSRRDRLFLSRRLSESARSHSLARWTEKQLTSFIFLKILNSRVMIGDDKLNPKKVKITINDEI